MCRITCWCKTRDQNSKFRKFKTVYGSRVENVFFSIVNILATNHLISMKCGMSTSISPSPSPSPFISFKNAIIQAKFWFRQWSKVKIFQIQDGERMLYWLLIIVFQLGLYPSAILSDLREIWSKEAELHWKTVPVRSLVRTWHVRNSIIVGLFHISATDKAVPFTFHTYCL